MPKSISPASSNGDCTTNDFTAEKPVTSQPRAANFGHFKVKDFAPAGGAALAFASAGMGGSICLITSGFLTNTAAYLPLKILGGVTMGVCLTAVTIPCGHMAYTAYQKYQQQRPDHDWLEPVTLPPASPLIAPPSYEAAIHMAKPK